MPTAAEAEAHRQAVNDVTTLAKAELVALWRTLDTADAAATQATLFEAVPAIVGAYGLASATLAADFYDDLREQVNLPGSFTATLADLAGADRTNALVGWGTAPLRTEEPKPDLALSRLSGGLQRTVANADRDTIAENVAADPAQPRYARHASANACAFCALLATRGPTYGSEEDAGTVTDLTSERFGEKYHDSCRCVSVPVWPGQEYHPAPYVADWERAYTDATRSLGEPGRTGLTSAQGLERTLARMRETLGTN